MKFKPLHDRVLIEVLDSSEKTAGGIIIPDSAQEKPQEGKVVAVGGGSKTEDGKIIPMDVKVGDKVSEGDVLCIIEAMKMMNEVKSDYNGVIKEILISDAEPVEYGEALFVIEE